MIAQAEGLGNGGNFDQGPTGRDKFPLEFISARWASYRFCTLTQACGAKGRLSLGYRIPARWAWRRQRELTSSRFQVPATVAPMLARLVSLGILYAMSVFSGCATKSESIFSTDSEKVTDQQRQEIKKKISVLARGKDPDNIEDSAAYSEAVADLTSRGSTVEPYLIEALNGSDDWSVRMGAVEVLQSVGTKACVEALIASLMDDHALVALYSERLLRVLSSHQEIPDAGQPAGANGLPPVPAKNPQTLALDAEEKIWGDWHREHRAALHQAWSTWWEANKKTAAIR
jgi:hypothetical protein